MTVELTKDYATAERDFREHGYCLLESVLPAAQLTGLRDRVAELAEQERRDSTAYAYDKDSQRIFSLHAKGGVFPDIIEHPIMLRLMESILGYNFLLPSSHANDLGTSVAAESEVSAAISVLIIRQGPRKRLSRCPAAAPSTRGTRAGRSDGLILAAQRSDRANSPTGRAEPRAVRGRSS